MQSKTSRPELRGHTGISDIPACPICMRPTRRVPSAADREVAAKGKADPRLSLRIALDAIKSHNATVGDILHEIEHTHDEAKKSRLRIKLAPIQLLVAEIKDNIQKLKAQVNARPFAPETHIAIQDPRQFDRECPLGHVSKINIYVASSGPVCWDVPC
jgi:hypothetical protein